MLNYVQKKLGLKDGLSSKQEFKNKLKEIDTLVKEFDLQDKQEDLSEEFSNLISILNTFKRISLNPIIRDWQHLLFISDSIESVFSLIEKDELSSEKLKKIRLSIESNIISYQSKLNPISKFFKKRYHQAVNSNYFVSKMVFGLIVSSSISILILIIVSIFRYSYVPSDKVKELSALYSQKRSIEREVEVNNNLLLTIQNLKESDSNEIDFLLNRIQELTKKLGEVNQNIFNREADINIDVDPSVDNVYLLVIVVASGTLGSTISMIIRIQEFDAAEQKFNDPLTPILIGAFRPLIGASFSLFVFSLISAEIVSVEKIIKEDPTNKIFFYVSVSFVAGFSERFARSFINKVEENFSEKVDQSKKEFLEEVNKLKAEQDLLKEKLNIPLSTSISTSSLSENQPGDIDAE